jgi:hypothetical protein
MLAISPQKSPDPILLNGSPALWPATAAGNIIRLHTKQEKRPDASVGLDLRMNTLSSACML